MQFVTAVSTPDLSRATRPMFQRVSQTFHRAKQAAHSCTAVRTDRGVHSHSNLSPGRGRFRPRCPLHSHSNISPGGAPLTQSLEYQSGGRFRPRCPLTQSLEYQSKGRFRLHQHSHSNISSAARSIRLRISQFGLYTELGILSCITH